MRSWLEAGSAAVKQKGLYNGLYAGARTAAMVLCVCVCVCVGTWRVRNGVVCGGWVLGLVKLTKVKNKKTTLTYIGWSRGPFSALRSILGRMSR